MIVVDKKTIVATNMDTTGEQIKNGIIIPAEGFSSRGIHPRWCKVYKVGSEVKDISEGQWLYVEHGRWTYAIDTTDENGDKLNVWVVDAEGILLVADEKPAE